MPAIAMAAAHTTTLRVGALVFDNDYKHPAILAKEVATIDLLCATAGSSSASARAGCGPTTTRSACPTTRPAVRVDRFEEALHVIKQCFAGEHVHASRRALPHHRLRGVAEAGAAAAARRSSIGGGGKRVLRSPAREADIVGINPNLRAGAIGLDAAKDSLAEQTDQKVEWIREAAGARIDDIEIQMRFFITAVTDDRMELAEALAPGFGVSPEEALEVGLALRRHRGRDLRAARTAAASGGVSLRRGRRRQRRRVRAGRRAPRGNLTGGSRASRLAREMHDPGLQSLRRAARVAIVVPVLFAIFLNGYDNPVAALFAGFGSFAFLGFADFGGPPLAPAPTERSSRLARCWSSSARSSATKRSSPRWSALRWRPLSGSQGSSAVTSARRSAHSSSRTCSRPRSPAGRRDPRPPARLAGRGRGLDRRRAGALAPAGAVADPGGGGRCGRRRRRRGGDHDRAEDDQHRANRDERSVGAGARERQGPEVREPEERERAEAGEERGDRIVVAVQEDREQDRDDDGHSGRSSERLQSRVVHLASEP